MNIKISTIMINSLLLIALLNMSCLSGNGQDENKKVLTPDTTQRPANVSRQATLINFGGDDLPVFVWVEAVGPLIADGKEYSHIRGIKFTYVKPRKSYTEYYENLNLRNGARKFNFKTSKVLEYPGEANIHLASGKDTLPMFHVLGNDELERMHRGIKFKDISTVSRDQYGEYIADTDMECNIKKDGNGMYIVTLNNGSKIIYKSTSKCNVSEESVSFLNREDGKIYLFDRSCCLELVNKEDVKKFQDLR
ncbi:hypothetical protein [Chitinophaga ginsengisoli]|uniref:Lipoprotein n=1 Tax=Chitinophaga ginsengisoli TaxID=363837 RepID=A0A2P8FC26_9BACT|nr:hypothetical protein [Chitinophaga ginsengisoli]PSL19287.1 hypothetical protein CLV42_12822 [Chitinophaga ginsengisoli]